MADYGRIANVLIEPAVGETARGRIGSVLVEPAVGETARGRIGNVLVEPAVGDTPRVWLSLAVVEVFVTQPKTYTEMQAPQGYDVVPHLQGDAMKGVR